MSARGPLSHIDLSVRDPAQSIPFYATLFEALGWRRMRVDLPDFIGPDATRAAWFVRYGDGAFFGLEVRPASSESRDKPHDRYAPGLHHMAFHAESAADVDWIYERMREGGARVLDPPVDYSAHPAYSPGYYATFFADPDGMKVEVVYEPRSNP